MFHGRLLCSDGIRSLLANVPQVGALNHPRKKAPAPRTRSVLDLPTGRGSSSLQVWRNILTSHLTHYYRGVMQVLAYVWGPCGTRQPLLTWYATIHFTRPNHPYIMNDINGECGQNGCISLYVIDHLPYKPFPFSTQCIVRY